MAAPSGTTWGNTVGSYGRLGIFIDVLTDTPTQLEYEVEIWIWTKYSTHDTNNTLYYDHRTTSGSASTNRGSKDISTTVSSGSPWPTANQKRIATYGPYTINRTTTTQKRYIYARLIDVDTVGGTMYASKTYGIAAKTSYTVSYNANGGSGAPSSQTKWYGAALTLSSTKPTRTGYTFQGWATSASGSVAYAAGASYTGNAALTLYAVWKANTYTISYNANGGSGAPGSQTKTYGTALTLSSTKPTRTNYTFKGWSLSANSTTVAYSAGGSYTENAGVTLYAVWQLNYTKPRISGLSVSRCNSSGVLSDDGTYLLVKFSWACDKTVSSITVKWSTSDGNGSATITASGTSGSVNNVVGGSLSTEKAYTVAARVTDSLGYTENLKSVHSIRLTIDALPEHKGVAFGKVAEDALEDFADFGYATRHRKKAVFDNDLSIYGRDSAGTEYSALIPVTSSGNTSLGHGLYKAGKGHTHIYGNDVQFYTNNGIYANSNKIVLNNAIAVTGKNTDGTEVHLISQSENNNTIIGYNNYTQKSGNSHIYGHDILHFVSSIATPGSYRPYYRAGDVINVEIKTSGYCTNSKEDIYFVVPLAKPVLGNPTVICASVDGLILRQGGKYTHGSAASTFVRPAGYAEEVKAGGNCIQVKATRNTTTNAVNNEVIAVHWVGTITFA